MAYIYQIQNDVNGKLYVGKTEFSLEKRFKEHCQDAFRERNEKRPLYSAMRKYGIEHFHISLIEETNNPEEREKFWIEYLGTFKNGYNATIGGDGKAYIDYELVIATYSILQNQKAVAKAMDISVDSVRSILRQKNVKILSSQEVQKNKQKPVKMYTLFEDSIRTFPSLKTAARFLISQKLTNCKESTIANHISEVCRGKRKTAAGYRWAFMDIEY